MTRAEILSLGTQATGRILKASDTGTYFVIEDGGDGSNAVAIVTSNPLGYSGTTVIENMIGITEAGFATIGSPNANTKFDITNSSNLDYSGVIIGKWQFDTATTATPAAAELRINHATPASATILYLNSATLAGVDIGLFLAELRAGDKLLIQHEGTPANFAEWTIGAAPSLSSGVWSFPGDLTDSSGTGTSGFADALRLIVGASKAVSAGALATRFTVLECDCLCGGLYGAPQMTGLAVGSGSLNADAAGTVNHPGIFEFRDSTTVNGGYRLATAATAFLLGGGEVCEFILKPETGLARTTAIARLGFDDSATIAAPIDGVWLELVGDGSGITVSGKSNSASGGPVVTASTYTAAAGTWYRAVVTIATGATSATFALYSEAGTLLWTDTVASLIPVGVRTTGFALSAYESTTDAATLNLSVDYFSLSINRSLAR